MEVWSHTRIEPKSTPITDKEINIRTESFTNEKRLNIRARGIWERGQQAFFSLRFFDLNASSHLNKSLQQCHVMDKQENKRAYKKRVLQIKHGRFKPLVFSRIVHFSLGKK